MSGTLQPGPPSLPCEEAEKLYIQVPGEAPIELPEAPIAVEFRVTDHRLSLYGYTDGCVRCDTGDPSRGYSPECKAIILKCFLNDNTDRQAIRERKILQKKRRSIIVPMDGFGSTAMDHDATVLNQVEADMIIGEVLEPANSGGASGSGNSDPPAAEQPARDSGTVALVTLPKEPDYLPSLGSCMAAVATVAGVAIECIFKPQIKNL